MPEGESSTERFLRLVNEANAKIAAAQFDQRDSAGGEDPVRCQRDQERREKYGQLRARPKGRSKTQRVRNVFGHTRVDGSDTSG